jgi:putative FmdB family regulatory protein
MPVYEYYCSKCNTKFDALRGMKEADEPIRCATCESPRTARVLSVFFAAKSDGGASQPLGGMGGGCACGGACACGHSHN